MSTTERIEVVVSERGAPTVARQIGMIGDRAEASAIQTNRLKNALVALSGATGVIQLGRLVDTYTNMQNRLRVVTTSSAQLKAVQQDLFSIANRTRSSYEATVEMFSRMSLALKDAGTSTATLLKVTASLNQATIVSGASAEEAKNALIQLSQGLASGTLRGEELRSVLEQLPIVADAIAAKLGPNITRGSLRKLAEENRLTTQLIIEAVTEAGEKWEELFQKTIPTMSQGLTVLKNRFMEVTGSMDENLGVSANIAKAMLFIARHMDIVAGAATTLASVLAVTLARYAFEIVIGRMIDFFALLVVGPITSFATALGAITSALVLQSKAFLGATAALGAYMIALGGNIFSAFGRIAAGIASGVAAMRGFSVASLAAGLTARNVFTALVSVVGLIFSPIRLATGLVTGLGTAMTLLATGGIAAMTRGLTALGALVGFLFRGFGTLVQLVVGVGVAMVTLGDKATIAANSTITYKDVAIAAWNNIKTGFGNMVNYITSLWPTIGNGATKAFGQMDGGFLGFAQRTAKGLDLVRAAFLATYDVIVSSWRSLPAALLDAIIQGLKAAFEAILEFGGKVYNYIKELVSNIISGNFDAISVGGLDTNVEGAASRIATTWNDALSARIKESTAFSDGLAKVLDDAGKVSSERIAKEKAELEALAKAREEFNIQGKNNVTPLAEDGKRGPKEFKDYLADLQREQELGLAIGDRYKVLNEQLAIASKLRRDLTADEKAAVETAVLANLEMERQRSLLEEIKGPTQEYQANIQALTGLYQQGAITLEEFNNKFWQLRENFLNGLPEATTFADGFSIQIQKMQMATRNGFGQMGTEVAKIFGPGGTLINGIGDAVAQSIVFGKSFKEQIRGIAQSILSQLISSLVKMGLNMVMNAALGNSLMAGSTAMGVAQAGALTAAYTPAAAMASLATGGTNATGAASGISSIFSILASLGGSLFMGKGFSDGGYTGAVGVKDVAGVVHGQEFVINAAATKRHRSLLEAINAGKDPLQPIAMAAASGSQPVNVSITNEIPDAAYEVRALTETEVEIIAKRVVRRETPEVVAQDLRNPNSRTSKGLSSNTTANRRR